MKTTRVLVGLLALGAFSVHCGDDTGSGGDGGAGVTTGKGATTATGPGPTTATGMTTTTGMATTTTGATTSNTTATTTTAATTTGATTTGNGGGGGGPNVTCIDVLNHPATTCTAPDPALCECEGCTLPQCDDGMGTFADCVCAVCATDAFCANAGNCVADGLCDPYGEGCVCADCFAHPQCAGQVEDCNNGVDDNGNGLTDCADTAYCALDPQCLAAACGMPTAAVIGANAGDTTNGSNLLTGSCTGGGATEVVYSFTPASDGALTLTLASATDQGVYVQTTCGDAGTEIGCVDAVLGGTDEVLTLFVTGGVPLTIVVDGFTPAESGPYTLTVAFSMGACLDDGSCDAQGGEDCACVDCVTEAICGFCGMDATCDLSDACTCTECNMDAFCTDPQNCSDDGFCNQFLEGCQCADCAGLVPNCP